MEGESAPASDRSAMQRGCPGRVNPLDHLFHACASMRRRPGGRLAGDFRLRVDPRRSTVGALSAVRQARAQFPNSSSTVFSLAIAASPLARWSKNKDFTADSGVPLRRKQGKICRVSYESFVAFRSTGFEWSPNATEANGR